MNDLRARHGGLCGVIAIVAFLFACHSTGVVGRHCDAGECRKPMDAAVQEPPPDPEPTPVLDACADGSCEPDACAGDTCTAAPSCDRGLCQSGVCDGGACEPDVGCNAAFPICPSCSIDSDCTDDREEPFCDTVRGRCVECLNDAQCSGDEPYCIAGDCEECRTDADCSESERCLNGDCDND